MKRLWDKGVDLNSLVRRFTVGNDPQLDQHLVHFDCLGSAAHARTLERAGILTTDEADRLIAELARIDALASEGKFPIPDELEDCHTAIEAHLTDVLGELGGKIHAGRSRNDQVATASRLYMRHHAIRWTEQIAETIDVLSERIRRDGATPMPGYTHMQPAMPSCVRLWLHAFAEAFLEQLRAVGHLLAQLDRCPLGTGAGYGSGLPLDRPYTAALLGFSCEQRNPIDVQNSRGRMEVYFVRVAADLAAVVERLACDLLLFTTAEFNFFGLPESLTTGSSIMPQKKNPDVLELVRAHAVRLRAGQHELEGLVAKLPSGYQRDLQLTKEPMISAACEIADLLPIAQLVIQALVIHHDRLQSAMRPELFATHAALKLVHDGLPFRQAYRQVAESLREGQFTPPAATAPFSTDWLEATEADVQAVVNSLQTIHHQVNSAETSLLPQSR